MINLSERTFLIDENLGPLTFELIDEFANEIISVPGLGLTGSSDIEIIRAAIRTNAIIITQDSDFAKLVMLGTEIPPGIIYLRPGHVEPEFHANTLRSLFRIELDLKPGFILVAESKAADVVIRYRNK